LHRIQKIELDDSRWPIVVMRYPPTIDDDDFARHIERIVSYIQRREPWGLLNDTRDGAIPNLAQTKAIVAMYDANEALVRTYWRGTALVFDSPFFAAVLTTLTWMRPQFHPFKAFRRYDDAMAWLTERLEAECRAMLEGCPTQEPRDPGSPAAGGSSSW
jgi:hypothetical protein